MPRLNEDDRSPAQFAVLMHVLGVETSALADALGVTARSVRDWRRSRPAPDAAWRYLDERLERAVQSVGRVLDWLDDQEEQRQEEAACTYTDDDTVPPAPPEVVLRTYASDRVARQYGEHEMTAAENQAIVGLIAIALEDAGYPWRIEFYPDHDPHGKE